MIGETSTERERHGKIERCVVLILVALLSGGCWDRVEINDLSIVRGVALDKGMGNTIDVTLSISVPAGIAPPGAYGAPGRAPQLTTKTASGRTVSDAVATLQTKLSRRVFWAHNSVVLISEELAREGVRPLLDFFARNRQPRLTAILAVTNGRASDVLATIPTIERDTPSFIREVQTYQTNAPVDVRQFIEALATEGQEPFTAHVKVVRAGAVQPGRLEPTQGAPVIPGQPNPPQPAVVGSAIFLGTRLVGFLDEEETQGVLWLRDDIEQATVTFNLGEPEKWVSLRLRHAGIRLKPRLEGDRIVMGVEILASDDLIENAAGVDTQDPAVVDSIRRRAVETLSGKIRKALAKLQGVYGSDVVGFGKAVHMAFPDLWREIRSDWDRLFRQIEVDLDIHLIIERTGMSLGPISGKSQGTINQGEFEKLLKENQ